MQRIKPRFASKAEMKGLEAEITRRVEDEIKRRLAEAKRPVGKSAPRPVLRAHPVGTASSAATLADVLEGLQARLDGMLAKRQEARDLYSAKVGHAVAGLAGIRKDLAGVREQFDTLHGIRRDFGKVVERMTAEAGRRNR